MTTSTIAATGTRAQASAAKAKPAEGGNGESFSAVLTLKLGMGLNAAVEVAQSVPNQARDRTAEPARDPVDPGAEAEARVDAAEEEASDAEAAEAREKDTRDRDAVDLRDKKQTMAREELRAEARSEGPEGREPGVNQAKTAEAEPGPSSSAVASAAQTAPQGPTTREAVDADAGPLAVDASGAARTKAVAKGAAPGSERAAREDMTYAGVPDQIRKPGKGTLGKADGDDALAERGPRPRDPLGLIREAAPEAAEAPRTSSKDEKRPSEGQPTADLGLVQPRQADPSRTRFADSGEEAAARAAASAVPVQAGPPAFGTPQPPGVVAANAASSGRVGSVGAASGGGVGGAGVGGGANGGGGAGAGFGHEFGGLFAGGRGFGVAFGAAVKGKSAVGAVSAKGESKEQIQAQISRGLAAALRQKGGVMSLRLNPEHLGSMKIDLTIEGGRVTATFDAQSEQARQALRDGIDGLKRSIEETGLTVKSIEVVGTAAVGTPAPTQTTNRDDRAASDLADRRGEQRQDGHQQRGDQRDNSAPWAQERPEAHAALDAADAGGVWAEEDGSASGLLRLRVDAVV